jgi:transposase
VIRPCAGNLFWLSNEQWERIKPHLPTDVRGVERAESSAASYMYSRAAVAVAIARPSTDRRHQSADTRRAVRQERSKPLVFDLKAWFEDQLTRLSGKSKTAEAIRYAFHHWEGLTRFLDDGRVMDAENWACIASLIETCKLHGVDPQTYFADVLTQLVNLWPASHLDDLMPWHWAVEKQAKLAA